MAVSPPVALGAMVDLVRLDVHEALAQQRRALVGLEQILHRHRVDAALRQVVGHAVLPFRLEPLHREVLELHRAPTCRWESARREHEGRLPLEARLSGGGAEQRFFHTEDAAATRALLEIRMTADGQWALDTFLRSGDDSLTLLDRAKQHPADRWHWVALSYDGQTMRHFVDGALELQGDVRFAPMKPTGKTSLGVRQNRVSWFKGSLRELRFHSAALEPGKLQRAPRVSALD